MSRWILFLCIGFLSFPSTISAKETTVWDFQGNVPGRWEGSNLTSVTPTPEGLHVVTKTTGKMRRTSLLTHPVDVITFIADAPTKTEMNLIWHEPGTPEDEFVNLPFVLHGNTATTHVNLTRYPEWDRTPEWIGMEFTEGTDITIRSIQLTHWNFIEKIFEGWKSFWTFDHVYSYSINFLWGPLVATNPIAREELFKESPPYAWSANRFFYLLSLFVVLVTLAWVWLCAWSRPARAKALAFLALAIGSLWIFYDLRMGMELLTYAKDDLTHYTLKPRGQRSFRALKNFHDIVEFSIPFLPDRYALLLPTANQLFGIATYLTYPKLPIPQEGNFDDIPVWLIFYRSDITITEKDQLAFTDPFEVFTPPGKVLHRFDDHSFLFQVTPPSTKQ